jgi:hypothetical protein
MGRRFPEGVTQLPGKLTVIPNVLVRDLGRTEDVVSDWRFLASTLGMTGIANILRCTRSPDMINPLPRE